MPNTDAEDLTPRSKAKRERKKTGKQDRSKNQRKVAGSGFTYDESKGRTDQSSQLDETNADQAVKLPDLGQKNRP